MSSVSITKTNSVIVEPVSIKRSNKFTCMGWISNISIPDSYPLYLLAVSDISGDVVGSDESIKIGLSKSGGTDYVLQFSNSESKPIRQYLDIAIDDGNWHLLTYVCLGEGVMRFYIDSVLCDAKEGTGDEGMLYSVAWSRYSRLGGGDVWLPYLYRNWQSVIMYQWRYASGLVLHQEWIQELYNREREQIDTLLEA
jgi:hypothetical protein